MVTPYLGEIKIVSFNFPPKGWAACNGQTMATNQNQALFALLGTIYGGNGTTTFQLPNLQGCTPLHRGGSYVLGQRGGETAHVLTINEMAQHNHQLNAADVPADVGAAGKTPGVTKALAQAHAAVGTSPVPVNLYGTGAPNAALDVSTVAYAGNNLGHNNQQPYLVLNFCIALQGVYPSVN